jgi:hypothetical protein
MSIQVSEKGINIVGKHLAQFGEWEPNQAMMQRLTSALGSGTRIAGADASFYLHELSEATMMRAGASYDLAHAAALAKYGVSAFSVYHQSVVAAYPHLFNANWSQFWRVIP